VERHEVVIVGAGLAGCAAALELDDKGITADVFEALRDKEYIRGPQLTGTAYILSTIPNLVKPKYRMRSFTFRSGEDVAYFDGNRIGNVYEVCSTEGAEQELRDRLHDRGIEINYGHRIKNTEELRDYKHVVIADGYSSQLAKSYGLRSDAHYLTSYGLMSEISGRFEPESPMIELNSKVAPGGYIFFIPWDERRANAVAFPMLSQHLDIKSARETFRRWIEENGWKTEKEWTEFQAFYRHPCYERDGVYLAGSAASFTDEFMGFGLYYAVESGIVCADAISEGKSYEEALKETVLDHLKIYRSVAPLMRNAGPKTHELMVKAVSLAPARHLVNSGFDIFRYLEKASSPIALGGTLISNLHSVFLNDRVREVT
jgi:flavin-dependent dehydrogenase